MSLLARRAASQLLSSRSLHLRIQPRPANLSEGREVLRVLQRYGEITTYKYLRYEYHNPAHNIALVIYRDADAAQQALNASPIRFSLEKIDESETVTGERQWSEEAAGDDAIVPEFSGTDGVEDMTRPGHLLNHMPSNSSPIPDKGDGSLPTSSVSKPPIPMPFEQPIEVRKISTKWIQITLDRSRVIHQDYVERQPYWKQFSPMRSMGQEDLATSVPYPGLSDVSKRPLHAHRTPNKVLGAMSNYVEHKMPSLKDMYEKALSAKG